MDEAEFKRALIFARAIGAGYLMGKHQNLNGYSPAERANLVKVSISTVDEILKQVGIDPTGKDVE